MTDWRFILEVCAAESKHCLQGAGKKQTSNLPFPSLPFPVAEPLPEDKLSMPLLPSVSFSHPLANFASLFQGWAGPSTNLTDCPQMNAVPLAVCLTSVFLPPDEGSGMSPMKYGLKSPIPDLKFQAIIQPHSGAVTA